MISKISQFDNIFKGEMLTVVGSSYFERRNIGGADFILSMDRGFNLCESSFWGSSHFPTLFYKYADLILEDKERRILTPDKINLDGNFIHYVPKPIWVFGGDYIEKWKKRMGEDCPVGWGSLGLAIGFAFRLGFSHIEAWGFNLDPRGWDPISQTYVESQINEEDRKKGFINARKISILLGIGIDIKGI